MENEKKKKKKKKSELCNYHYIKTDTIQPHIIYFYHLKSPVIKPSTQSMLFKISKFVETKGERIRARNSQIFKIFLPFHY